MRDQPVASRSEICYAVLAHVVCKTRADGRKALTQRESSAKNQNSNTSNGIAIGIMDGTGDNSVRYQLKVQILERNL